MSPIDGAFICKLRMKLILKYGGDDYVETGWGRGHVLRHPRSIHRSPDPSSLTRGARRRRDAAPFLRGSRLSRSGRRPPGEWPRSAPGRSSVSGRR
jgi:hypothetical protein